MSDTSDRVNEENSKKIYEKAKQHSDKFELNTEYNSIIDNIGKSHETFSDSHKDEILRMAKILDQVGDTKKEKICAKVCKDLEPHGIKERYVRKVLPDEYKNQSQTRTIEQNNVRGPRAANEAQDEEQKLSLLVTNNGETLEEDLPNPNTEIDKIYGGKSFSQMQKEADREIAEDKDETLENPNNGPVPNNTTQFLSDKSPEFREMAARLAEQDIMIRQMAEDRDTAREQAKIWSSKFNKLRGGSLEEENRRLKVECSNLNSILGDVDKKSIEEEGYKEIEVLKINPLTINLLLDVSRKSQKTLFLLVNPKTMLIKGVKTDVLMHSIQAKRAAGV